MAIITHHHQNESAIKVMFDCLSTCLSMRDLGKGIDNLLIFVSEWTSRD